MWIAVVAIVVIVLIVLIKIRASSAFSKRIRESNSALRLGIFIKLKQKYLPTYGDDSTFLAVGIINEILNEEPTNSEGRRYKENNLNLIRQKTKEIIAMPEYADSISLLLFTQWTCLIGEASRLLTARAHELSLTISPPIKMLEISKDNKSVLINMIQAFATDFVKQSRDL